MDPNLDLDLLKTQLNATNHRKVPSTPQSMEDHTKRSAVLWEVAVWLCPHSSPLHALKGNPLSLDQKDHFRT